MKPVPMPEATSPPARTVGASADPRRADLAVVAADDRVEVFPAAVEQAFDELEQLIRLTEEQRRAIEALREVRHAYERMGTDMVALRQIIAHELCNPLTTVVAALDIVCSRRDLSEDDREALLTRAQRQARAMATLVDDLLHRAPTETVEATRSDAEPVELADLLDDVLDRVSSSLPRELVVCDLPPSLTVVTDRARLERILTNLLANAAKHAPGATVEVRAARHFRSVTIEIADRGPGIHPADAGQYFEPFARAHDESPGLGLGLYLVRSLARTLGGDATLDRRDGGGTVAKVTLPQQRAGDEEAIDLTVNDLRAIRAVRGA